MQAIESGQSTMAGIAPSVIISQESAADADNGDAVADDDFDVEPLVDYVVISGIDSSADFGSNMFSAETDLDKSPLHRPYQAYVS